LQLAFGVWDILGLISILGRAYIIGCSHNARQHVSSERARRKNGEKIGRIYLRKGLEYTRLSTFGSGFSVVGSALLNSNFIYPFNLVANENNILANKSTQIISGFNLDIIICHYSDKLFASLLHTDVEGANLRLLSNK